MRTAVLIAAGLALLALLVFGRVAFHDFINFDDTSYVTRNPNVNQGLGIASTQWAFTTTHMSIWHPATWISHMLDCQIYGTHPAGHHITSLLLHIGSTILLFVIFLETTRSTWCSALVAALFCVHPLRVESVAWVAQRKDVLSVFFGLLSLFFYSRFARHPSGRLFVLTTAALLLALLSKPMMVTLPFAMLLMDVWPLERISSRQGTGVLQRARFLVREKTLWFALSAAASVVTYLVMARAGTIASGNSIALGVRLANASQALWFYLTKTFWPVDLSVFYPYPPPPPVGVAVVGGAVLAGAVFASWRFFGRFPYVAVGWTWFLVGLVPVLGLVQQAQHLVADRYAYFPHIGLLALFVWGGAHLSRRIRSAASIAPVIGIAVVIALSVVSFRQTNLWATSLSLFGHAVECDPDNHVAHQNLGSAYFAAERWQEATHHYAKALEVNPYYHTKEPLLLKSFLARSSEKFALELQRRGDNEQALRHYLLALEHGSRSAALHYNAGNVLLALERYEEAGASFALALELDPGYPDAENNLGIAQMKAGRLDEAERSFDALLERDTGDARALYNLACVASLKGDPARSIALIRRAIQNGFADRTVILSDPDLSAIRDTEEFRQLLEQLSPP